MESLAAAVLPETPYHELTWVMVLAAARVHTGPSVDTPITDYFAVGTALRATQYRNEWFEIIEPSTSKSGWIYQKYLGAIGYSEQSKIASQQVQAQSAVAEVSVPADRYAKAIRSSKQSTRVKPATPKPIRGHTEMASLLQRAFSGY